MLTLCCFKQNKLRIEMKKLSLFFLLFLLTITSSNLFAKIYKGAEYRTKESFLYGRFEASFKAAGKEGTLSTMFTYFDGTTADPWASSKWSEIDIEVIGRYKNDVQFNTITSYAANHVRHNLVNFDPALDYHTYAFEWTPDYIAWFIDGVEVYRQTDSFVKTVTHAQKFMFNMWVPTYTNWMGVFTDKILPAFTSYDWASYYAYTPGSGNYGSGNNFKFSWRDDFDTFDSNRWAKATHTFDGNNSDMLPDNINFKDGKMILSLTTSSEVGMIDKKPPVIISTLAINENVVQVFFSEQVEKISAETASQYIIAGLPETKKATLLSDLRTVELSVEKLNLSALPTLVLMAGIKDLANPANSSVNQAKTIMPTLQLKFPIKINIGGGAYKDFLADREFRTDTASYGYMEGSKFVTTTDIANTVDDSLFQNGIYNMAKYVVRVPNGKYRVKLLFSENTISGENIRVFDVYLQGKQVIKGLDVFKEVGSKTALEKVFEDVVVSDYMLDVHFAALKNSAIVNGIIIEQIGTDVEEHSSIPDDYQLEQNYPNPFNPSTAIGYRLSAPSYTSLKVYDALGCEVATLVSGYKQPGKYTETLHSTSLPSGVYFYKLQAGGFVQTKKMMLMK
ncbi:MAG: family 16 glycosylhydrolase [Ignavibacteria bacterium]|nr:family 16 glycosylhydrolase [Ignavibacteria bacterium]